MSDLRETVLVVDDDAIIADTWSMMLDDMGLETCGIAATAADAIDLAKLHRPRVVLMDMRLKGELDGVDAALAIHSLVGSKVIFVTGSQDPPTRARIQLDHPADVLFKPVFLGRFESAIRAAMDE